MMKKYVIACWLIIALIISTVTVLAAPIASSAKTQAVKEIVIQNIRISQAADRLRIVMNVNNLPMYKVTATADNLNIILALPRVKNKSGIPQIMFNDPVVAGLRFTADEPDQQKMVVELKMKSQYRVFNLQAPNRIVIDILKITDQKTEEQIVPGIKYTCWRRGLSFGPVTAYIADIDPAAGYIIKPVLSKDATVGLEPVLPITKRNKGIVGVNGSYFALNGEILGLLKINGQLASTPTIPRSAWGIYKDGRSIIDTVEYNGRVELPDGQSLTINGVNRIRGENELILYNDFYGQSTGTNDFGIDYVIIPSLTLAREKSAWNP